MSEETATTTAEVEAPPAATGPTLEERLAALEGRGSSDDRRSLMTRVLGPNIDQPVGQFFATRYEGELTEEAVRAAAEALNISAPMGATTAEMQAFSAAQDLRYGATAPGADPGPEPRMAAREMTEQARKSGATRDVSLGIFIDSLANAAVRGDRRILIDRIPAR